MVVSKKEIEKQIYEDWGSNPQSEICIAILGYLLRVPTNNLQHITYGSFRKVIGTNYSDNDLIQAIQYLCGDYINLLEAKFELIENDDNIFALSDDEVSLAQKTGMLIHPDTGEVVNNFKEKVFMYFKPSPRINLLFSKNVTR